MGGVCVLRTITGGQILAADYAESLPTQATAGFVSRIQLCAEDFLLILHLVLCMCSCAKERT